MDEEENPKPKKVLIVEDEKPLAQALQLKLKSAGIETKIAIDGQQALDEINSTFYNLVLLDILLPAMNGLDVLDDLKSRGIKTPVIVTSNLSDDQNIKKAKDLGAIDFIIKSNTSLDEIVEKVKKALAD